MCSVILLAKNLSSFKIANPFTNNNKDSNNKVNPNIVGALLQCQAACGCGSDGDCLRGCACLRGGSASASASVLRASALRESR